MKKNSSKVQFLNGLRAAIPVILGFIPVGIAYAIMARQAGFTIGQTCMMSLLVFAGASQMMVTGMYSQGAGILAMILATFILNLRHLIMSVCISNQLRNEKMSLKLLASFGVTDESFAIFSTEKQENCTILFFLGLVAGTYAAWNAGTLIGAVATNFLPDILTASLGIALYALFIGLLIPNLTHNFRLAALVILTAVCNTILTQMIPSGWSLILSTLICAFIGVFFVNPDEETTEDIV